MQPVPRLAPARPHARVAAPTTCQARATACRGCAWTPRVGVAPAPRRPRLGLRARATPCGGGAAEPVEARVDADPAEEPGLAPEELEVLEAAAIAGEDEGRRPTDYDRRAHIFEESSRVFRELKHRHDVDVDGGSGHGGVTAGATAAEAGTREQQQQQQLG